MKSAFQGMERWQGRLKQRAASAELRAETSSLEEAEAIKAAAQSYCPVATGNLRDSARVTQTGDGNYAVEFTAPYALIVHERLDVRHPTGQAKFLERACQEAQSGFGKRMGERFAQEGE